MGPFLYFSALQNSGVLLDTDMYLFSTFSDVNPMTDVVERVNDIYTAVVQSEECMERIACEVGGLAADVGLTQSPALR